MSRLTDAASLVGQWAGQYRLWLGPTEPVRESSTAATATAAAAGKFLTLTYTWADKGTSHDGVLIVRIDPEPSPMDMVWVDSFHTMGAFMTFEGRQATDGSLEATTLWSMGDGPAWGWRIAVSAPGADDLLVSMYVSTPTGEEAPAVEQRYSRSAR